MAHDFSWGDALPFCPLFHLLILIPHHVYTTTGMCTPVPRATTTQSYAYRSPGKGYRPQQWLMGLRSPEARALVQPLLFNQVEDLDRDLNI